MYPSEHILYYSFNTCNPSCIYMINDAMIACTTYCMMGQCGDTTRSGCFFSMTIGFQIHPYLSLSILSETVFISRDNRSYGRRILFTESPLCSS